MLHDKIISANAAVSTPCLLHTSTDGSVTFTTKAFETLEEADDALAAFRADRWTDRQAAAAIWDIHALAYDSSWIGGIAFGPRDTRHPMAEIYRRAIDAGARVTIINGQSVTRFNQGAAA